MKVSNFEETVWDVEGIRIVIRALPTLEIGEFDKERASSGQWSVTQWLDSDRLKGIGDHNFVVIAGNGKEPHGKTLLRNLRTTYTSNDEA